MKTPTVLALMIMQIGITNAATNKTNQEDDEQQIKITSTRQNKKKLDVPETIDVVNHKQIEEKGITNTQDLVRHLPGVSVSRQTSGTDPFGNLGGINIRGISGNRIQIQVDGARTIEEISGGNRNFVDLANLKAVEIIRGPGSVLWGADALGGVVSYRTLDPDDLLKGKNFAGKASLGFNSLNQQYSKTGMLAAQFSPKTQGLLSITHRTYKEAKLKKARADGGIWGCPRGADAIKCNELNPLEAEVFSILSKFVWLPNENHEVKLTGEYYSSDTDLKQMYDYGRQPNGSFNGDYLRHQKQTRTKIALEDTWTSDNPYFDQIKWQLSYSPQKRNTDDSRKQINVMKHKINSYAFTNYKEAFLQADLQFTSSFDLKGTRHQLIYGFQGDRTKTDYENVKTTDNQTTGVISVVPASGFNFSNSTTSRADFYLQDEIKLFNDYLTVTPGIRWATYEIKPRTDSDYKVIPGKEPKTIESKKWIPQLGLMLNLDKNYSLYGRYAEGFKMPTAQQLYTSLTMGTTNIIPNPDLKAEKVKSYETGVRGQFKNAWFSFGGFYSEYSDFIQSLQQINATDLTTRNLSEVKIWGIEASAEWRFLPNWTANASASYQYGKQRATKDSDKTYFDSASPLTGTLGIKWSKPEWRFDAELIGTFAKGVTRTASDDTFKPGGYGVFDSYFNWKLNRSVTLRASVQNIFNRRYFEAPMNQAYSIIPAKATMMGDVRVSNPLELQTAPGRTFGLDLSASF